MLVLWTVWCLFVPTRDLTAMYVHWDSFALVWGPRQRGWSNDTLTWEQRRRQAFSQSLDDFRFSMLFNWCAVPCTDYTIEEGVEREIDPVSKTQGWWLIS